MKQGDKKKIIERLMDVPTKGKRPFWAREMTLLNKLLTRWPNIDFWHKVRFKERLPSLSYLLTEWGLKDVVRKYNEFTFEIPPQKSYDLGDKVGEDSSTKCKPKYLKKFLND